MKSVTKSVIKIILCAVVALALTGVLCALLSHTDRRSLREVLDINGPIYDDSEYTVGDIVVMSPVDSIEIEWASGSVFVTAYDEAGISVTESGAQTEDDRLRWRIDDGKLIIRERAPGLFTQTLRKTLEVRIPKTLLLDLSLDVASAEVEISALSFGELDMDSASGSLKGDLLSADRISFDSSSGDCTLTACAANSFEMDSVSGKCNLDGSFETIDIDTTSGNFELHTDVAPRTIDLSGVSAETHLYLPADTEFTVTLDSVSGDLSTEGFSVTSNGKSGICGSGRNRYEFETVSGDVIITAE